MDVDDVARGDAYLGHRINEKVEELNDLLRQASKRKLFTQVDVTDQDMHGDEPPIRIVEVRLEKA
ncbi:hypothetical protein [Roseomonas sp. WA12]